MSAFEKIVLVTRKTRLEGLIERFNTLDQARFYIERSGGNFALYQSEHDVYRRGLDTLRQIFPRLAKFQEIERGYLPNFLFTDKDIVCTFGIDGLVVNTAKYLSGQPLLAINPDPEHIDGVLLPFTVGTAQMGVNQVLNTQATAQFITMAEAVLGDGQRLLAFNDLFIGMKNHYSARYTVRFAGQSEHQSSSGLIVSTGVGSSGWMSSLFNMTRGFVTNFSSTENLNLPQPALNWESDQLIFAVREPFVSKTSGAGIVCGLINAQQPLVLESEIPEGGVIFSDGVDTDFLAFNSGAIATIRLAQRKTLLVKPTEA